MNATVKVHLLGRDYLLRSQGEPSRIEDAAALVEERLAGLDSKTSIDTRDRFVLAMLNLAGEYLQQVEKSASLERDLKVALADSGALDKELGLQVEGLIERIEQALDD